MSRKVRHDKTWRSDHRGNLYYVRLKTEFGVMYKIGFTTFNSVEERMSRYNSNDVKYIDKVLMFRFLPTAFKVERDLHICLQEKRLFGKYEANPNFPLAKNGQSELYAEDVLGLDVEYNEEQRDFTLSNIKKKKLTLNGKTESQEKIEQILLRVVSVIFFPLALILVIVLSFLNGENTKKEILNLFDNITGGKKQQAINDVKIKNEVSKILRQYNLE